jgi:hypothetical protein
MPLKFATNQSLTSVTALPSAVPTDNLILISTQTASNSANISFTGINGTYDEYVFKFIDIHPRSTAFLQFQTSTNGGSSYGVTATTTYFYTAHNENDSTPDGLIYNTDADLAQSTSYQLLSYGGSGADESMAGSLSLFNPSSTTYVKHFISNFNGYPTTFTYVTYVAGYFNTTSAINAVQFNMSSGNFDGTIAMFGVL